MFIDMNTWCGKNIFHILKVDKKVTAIKKYLIFCLNEGQQFIFIWFLKWYPPNCGLYSPYTVAEISKVFHHPEVRELWGFPSDFLLCVEPVTIKCSTNSSIDFLFGTASFRCNLIWGWKDLCVAITDSPV